MRAARSRPSHPLDRTSTGDRHRVAGGVKRPALPAQEPWPCLGPLTRTTGSSSPIPRISNQDEGVADRPADVGRNPQPFRSGYVNEPNPGTVYGRSPPPGPSSRYCRARAVSAGATTARIQVVAGCPHHLEPLPDSRNLQVLSRPGSHRRRHPGQSRAMNGDGFHCCRSRVLKGGLWSQVPGRRSAISPMQWPAGSDEVPMAEFVRTGCSCELRQERR